MSAERWGWPFRVPSASFVDIYELTACVIARARPPGGDYIGFAPVFSHDGKLPAVEFLVAEVDDFRVVGTFQYQYDAQSICASELGAKEKMYGANVQDSMICF